MPKEPRCPADHPCENEPRASQPQSVPSKKPAFDITTMWKTTVPITNVKQNAKAIADKKDQMDKLKGEY